MEKKKLKSVIAELNIEFLEELGLDVIDEMAIPAYTKGVFISRYVFWKKLDWIVKFAGMGPYDSTLDFGCGTGVLLPSWSEICKNVFATDLEPRVAKALVARMNLNNITFVDTDLLVDRIPEKSLDLVIAANVLEHVEDRKSLMFLFQKLLKENGKLIVSGPTENSLYRFGRELISFKSEHFSGEYHVSNILDIIEDIEDSGFKIQKIRRWPFPSIGCLYQIVQFSPK